MRLKSLKRAFLAAFLLQDLALAIDPAALRALAQSSEFHNLLHMNNGASDILEPGFFFSKERTPLKEAVALFAAYEANASVACIAPARLSFLTQGLGLPLDLSACENLQLFLKESTCGSVRLGFATSSMETAMSYFGHNYLVFYRDEAPFFSQTVSFVAELPQETTARELVTKGIFGGFKGAYLVRPYFLLYEEYANKEARTLLEYELDLSPDERRTLLLHLYELLNTASAYKFFSKNCATNIYHVLRVANPRIKPRSELGGLIFLPSEVISAAHPFIRSGFKKSSLLDRIFTDYHSLSAQEAAEFRRIFKSSRKAELLAGASDAQRRLLNDTYDFLFKRANTVYGDWDEVKASAFTPAPLEEEIRPQKSKTKRLYFGAASVGEGARAGSSAGSSRLLGKPFGSHARSVLRYGFKGFLQSEENQASQNYSVSHLEILGFDFEGRRLREFNLVKLANYNKLLPFYKAPSWGMSLGWGSAILRAFNGVSFGTKDSIFSANLELALTDKAALLNAKTFARINFGNFFLGASHRQPLAQSLRTDDALLRAFANYNFSDFSLELSLERSSAAFLVYLSL